MKYSALIVFVALAVFWSSAEAKYNKYQDELITAMNNWAIEEMQELPEPSRTRIVDRLNETKNKQWDNVGLYFKAVQRVMLESLTEMLGNRRKRSIRIQSDVAETLQRISSVFDGYSSLHD